MENLTDNHTGIPFDLVEMQSALNQIKSSIENAIEENGEAGKNALIRSALPINLIHNVIKTSFSNASVHPSLINPELERLRRVLSPPTTPSSRPIVLKDKELPLAGYLKTKYQDISIVPNNIFVRQEVLSFPTYLNGFTDKFGTDFTEGVLSVNVRSQLSSIAKNFDTLYERTFAEALNFHLRLPRMVLGEVYLIIVKEYDSAAASRNVVAFKNTAHIEKYILAFQALNNRNSITESLYKYERVALLVVDFSQSIPKLYNSTQELIDDGLIPVGTLANLEALSYTDFVSDLMTIYKTRFPTNSFN